MDILHKWSQQKSQCRLYFKVNLQDCVENRSLKHLIPSIKLDRVLNEPKSMGIS